MKKRPPQTIPTEMSFSAKVDSSDVSPGGSHDRRAAISHRKATAPLQLSTSEWLNIVDFSRNGFVAVDSQGCITSLNETAARIIGTDIAVPWEAAWMNSFQPQGFSKS